MLVRAKRSCNSTCSEHHCHCATFALPLDRLDSEAFDKKLWTFAQVASIPPLNSQDSMGAHFGVSHTTRQPNGCRRNGETAPCQPIFSRTQACSPKMLKWQKAPSQSQECQHYSEDPGVQHQARSPIKKEFASCRGQPWPEARSSPPAPPPAAPALTAKGDNSATWGQKKVRSQQTHFLRARFTVRQHVCAWEGNPSKLGEEMRRRQLRNLLSGISPKKPTATGGQK